MRCETVEPPVLCFITSLGSLQNMPGCGLQTPNFVQFSGLHTPWFVQVIRNCNVRLPTNCACHFRPPKLCNLCNIQTPQIVQMNVADLCRLYVLSKCCSDPSKCAISSCTDLPSDPLKCACESSSHPLFCALIYSYKGSFLFLTSSLNQKSHVNSDPLFCACLKLSSTDLKWGFNPLVLCISKWSQTPQFGAISLTIEKRFVGPFFRCVQTPIFVHACNQFSKLKG